MHDILFRYMQYFSKLLALNVSPLFYTYDEATADMLIYEPPASSWLNTHKKNVISLIIKSDVKPKLLAYRIFVIGNDIVNSNEYYASLLVPGIKSSDMIFSRWQ